MATFAKDFVKDFGSLSAFAAEDGCYKVYVLPSGNNFISIRSEHDEQAMFGSSSCRGAKLVWQQGRTIPFDWDGFFALSRQFYGKTEQEAMGAARKAGIASDNIRELKVTRPAQSGRAEGVGADRDEAIDAAKGRVPADAFGVGEAEIIQTGEDGVLEIQAQTELVARQESNATVSRKEASVDRLECTVAPRKGFLGMGKKPGMWKAYWSVPFKAQVSYRLSAEVTLRYVESIHPPSGSAQASGSTNGEKADTALVSVPRRGVRRS